VAHWKWIACAAITLLILSAGCSDSKNPTGGQAAGNLTDPEFLAMQDFLDDAGATESWERSVDLTFQLLNWQFFAPTSGARPSPLWATAATQDVTIDSATYNYDAGWHTWHAWVTIYDFDRQETILVEGWDSLQIVVNNVPQQSGFDTLDLADADIIRVRAHFQYHVEGTTCSGAGHHRVDLTVTPFGTLGAMLLNASIRDTLDAAVGCISPYCALLFTSTATFTNVRFPFIVGESGVETADCPNAGSAILSAMVDLQCEGTDPDGLDTLSINGGWTITLDVQAEDDIRITFSNGTTLWSFVDTCEVITAAR
jgi:hypothetical protein